MFTMRLTGGAPIYEQLEQRIIELILSGEMAENEKLPAVREIAKQLSINPNTVQRTYSNLEAKGLIYSIPAKGSYVSPPEKYTDRIKQEGAEAFSETVKKTLLRGLTADELHNIINSVLKEVGNDDEIK